MYAWGRGSSRPPDSIIQRREPSFAQYIQVALHRRDDLPEAPAQGARIERFGKGIDRALADRDERLTNAFGPLLSLFQVQANHFGDIVERLPVAGEAPSEFQRAQFRQRIQESRKAGKTLD